MKHALLIAVEYEGEAHLPDARWNLKKVYKQLVEEQGYAPANICICTDTAASVVEKYTGGGAPAHDATLATIKREIKALMGRAREGDVLHFYFTGHGSSVLDLNFDEVDWRDEVLITSDRGALLDDFLYKHMVQRVPRGAVLNAVIDACKSGTIMDIPIVFNSSKYNSQDEESTFHAVLRKLFSFRKPLGDDVGLTFSLSSCTDSQSSQFKRKYIFGPGYGKFTRAYLKAMDRLGSSATYNDLIQHLYNETRDFKEQHFVVCASHKLDEKAVFLH